jgi:hypothetical protein
MTYHKSNLGSNGLRIISDIHGFVPTESTDVWELEFDHGGQSTHDCDGELTGYGEWFEEDRWPEIKAQAIRETLDAEDGIRRMRLIELRRMNCVEQMSDQEYHQEVQRGE